MDATQRFTSRVENYIRFRPGYPAAVLDLLRSECQLSAESVVADVGSGTGILSKMFLENGNRVYGVEPNANMREAGERLLASFPNFVSVAAGAEASTLPDRSVDFVTAAQALHWFDRARAKIEFARILKPGGWIAIVFNERRTDTTPFLCAYERLLMSFSTDYEKVDHRQITPEVIKAFFAPGEHKEASFENQQILDLAGLRGRLESSSYIPEPTHPKYAAMIRELESIFLSYQTRGTVKFEYDTKVYYGKG